MWGQSFVLSIIYLLFNQAKQAYVRRSVIMAVGLVGLYCFGVGYYCCNGRIDCSDGRIDCTLCQQSYFAQKRIV